MLFLVSLRWLEGWRAGVVVLFVLLEAVTDDIDHLLLSSNLYPHVLDFLQNEEEGEERKEVTKLPEKGSISCGLTGYC